MQMAQSSGLRANLRRQQGDARPAAGRQGATAGSRYARASARRRRREISGRFFDFWEIFPGDFSIPRAGLPHSVFVGVAWARAACSWRRAPSSRFSSPRAWQRIA